MDYLVEHKILEMAIQNQNNSLNLKKTHPIFALSLQVFSTVQYKK